MDGSDMMGREDGRLAALARYDVLDTPREDDFDSLARLAAEICRTPVGLITFVDRHRQFFKSAVGFAGETTAPLDVGFCPQVVEEREAITIGDTHADPAHAANPAVAANNVRFYAGVPLLSPDEHVLGTLCVLDTEAHPDALSDGQQRSLKSLAKQVMTQLELRRSEATARREHARAEKHSSRLRLLADASAILLTCREPEDMVERLFALVAAELSVDIGFHYRCGEGALGLVAAAGLSTEQRRSAVRIEFGQYVCGIVAERREPMHVANIQSSDEELFRPLRGLGLESYYSTPLVVGDELLGTIAFGRQKTVFTSGEVEALQTIASQLAVSLERQLAEHRVTMLNATLEERVAERSAQLQLYRTIVTSNPNPILAFDTELRVTAFNQAHADKFWETQGVRSEIGHRFPDHFIPEERPAITALMERALTGEAFTSRVEFGDPAHAKLHWDIHYTPLRDANGTVIGASHHAIEVTAQVQAERALAASQDALRQSQKMEAMGSLTGGVAHDFNNLLTPIVGSLDLLQRKGVGGERERRLIDGAAQSAERARLLVQRLLAFARRQPLQPRPVDVGALVAEMADLIASTTGPQIRVDLVIDDALPAALADQNQLEMALLNLAVNARDAMPEGGRLEVGARKRAAEGPPSAPGESCDLVVLSVTDTGVGMDAATIRRAVEPFFSTKGIGRGTGLGLSMVHGLAEQLGGTLAIASEVGIGTRIELCLPVTGEAVHAPAPVASAVASSQKSGVALLVDDEEHVRASTADMLADLGYDIVEAESGEAALALLDGSLRPDLLVTDHLMPGMTGTELVARVQERLPNLRVLVISGYAEVNGIAAELPRLVKPFRMVDLARSVELAMKA